MTVRRPLIFHVGKAPIYLVIERRKAWIYEVPLRTIHHARESLNAADVDKAIPEALLDRYDAPVLASTVKLWLLELDPPLALWDGWDDVRRIYPTGELWRAYGPRITLNVVKVGSGKTEQPKQEDHLEALRSALHRLPKVHLYVLDEVLKHIRS